MFFVGATGQLLTIILTVCLPFVFLVSSQPKLGLQQETINFQNQTKHQEVTSPEIISSYFIFTGIEKNQKISFEIGGIVIQKIPLPEFRIKCKTLYGESSGNKAPPSFNCYC